ncbi:hypothetical protein [Methanobacterium ferruginis]|uniref:hypothetical protein n=1 Tax=Methanobacterium ferruginis TaxID=710191 RepID=UPI0025735128|nr:hypothetical protein [Methanobacterium ferruginis]BDZ67385.1 hypothetical protein GCM10025860_08330 [Methanobacterium ferruginis]
MSKFEELGNLLEKSRSDYLDDIYRCSKFASELVRGLMEYLEIPESEQLVKFFKTKKKMKKQKLIDILGIQWNSTPKINFGTLELN